jgi:hypothetical protein
MTDCRVVIVVEAQGLDPITSTQRRALGGVVAVAAPEMLHETVGEPLRTVEVEVLTDVVVGTRLNAPHLSVEIYMERGPNDMFVRQFEAYRLNLIKLILAQIRPQMARYAENVIQTLRVRFIAWESCGATVMVHSGGVIATTARRPLTGTIHPSD